MTSEISLHISLDTSCHVQIHNAWKRTCFFLSQEFSILSEFLSELPCPLSFHQLQTDVAAQITPSRRLSSSAASFARVKFPADEERVHSVNTLTQATGVEKYCNLNTHDTSDQFT